MCSMRVRSESESMSLCNMLGTSVEVVSERTDSKLVGFASLLLVAGQQ